MPSSARMRIAFHGGVVWFVGLLAGFVVVTEEKPARLWHNAHESLILTGARAARVGALVIEGAR